MQKNRKYKTYIAYATFRHLFAELLNKEFETYEAASVCGALKMLETTTADFLKKHGDSIERIIFNVFKDCDKKIYKKILGLN